MAIYGPTGTKGPVIIYDRGGGARRKKKLQEKFSRPTQCADK